MTKEALDRIKEAYYSGLKVQIWFDGHWENFDVRDYPINTDPFSEHRMYRIVGSAYVDIAEKQIADLKKENADLEQKLEQTEKDLTDYQFNYPKIKDLEKENAELKKQVEQKQHLADVRLEQSLENYKLFSDERKERIDVEIALEDMTDKFSKAKDIIKQLLLLPYANNEEVYSDVTSVLDKAEQFLKDCDIDNAIQQANKELDFDKIADVMEQDLKDSEVEK